MNPRRISLLSESCVGVWVCGYVCVRVSQLRRAGSEGSLDISSHTHTPILTHTHTTAARPHSQRGPTEARRRRGNT